MRFLVDAQLPTRLVTFLGDCGHDAVHTSSLPAGNRSTDVDVSDQADAEDRIVVSKDADFRNSHLLRGMPRRLLVVATGNITNNDLLELFVERLTEIETAFGAGSYVELLRDAVVVHRRHGS